jgi:pyruvate-formate lyase-activating enzyme
MANRIFPIKVEPACLLKWSWSSVFLNTGTSASCHRTQPYTIDPNNFEEFHNLPEKITARKLMLDGQWPGAGCQHCKHIEDAGGISDRIHQLDAQGDVCQHPPELNTDPSATHITPTILEVYFKNTCNMACTYCNSDFSSRWEDEDRKFLGKTKTAEARSLKANQYDKMVKDLWIYLEKDDRYKILHRYHILGGEPFLLTELDDSIAFWESHPNINLIFSIITNLNIPTERFQKYVNRFERLVLDNKIWKLQITASLDAWGPQQEYVRYGLDLSQWQRNFEILVTKPWATLSINSTMSSLTIKHMPELIKKINYWNSLRGAEEHTIDHVFDEPIHHSFQTVVGNVDNPYIFGGGVFDTDMDEIISLMPADSNSQKSSREQMQGIAIALKESQRSPDQIIRLKQYLDSIDQRRQTNWRTLFTWLDESFE